MARRVNGLQLFSATMVRDREALGARVTEWMQQHPQYEIEDVVITQSSDSEFHCTVVAVTYFDPKAKR